MKLDNESYVDYDFFFQLDRPWSRFQGPSPFREMGVVLRTIMTVIHASRLELTILPLPVSSPTARSNNYSVAFSVKRQVAQLWLPVPSGAASRVSSATMHRGRAPWRAPGWTWTEETLLANQALGAMCPFQNPSS